MKEIMLLTAIATMLLLTACGPSKEELAKHEQLMMDSIRHEDAVQSERMLQQQKHIQDSLIAVIEKTRQDIVKLEATAKEHGHKKAAIKHTSTHHKKSGKKKK
jgi:uncharacterized protein YcfL